MKDSRVSRGDEIVPRMTTGYQYKPRKGLMPPMFTDPKWNYGAASLRSTAADLIAWLQALHGGGILSGDSYREFVSPGALGAGMRTRYAKGINVYPILGHRAIYHGGTTIAGFSSFTAYLPDDKISIVVLANTLGSIDSQNPTERIVRAVLGDRTAKPVEFKGRAADYVGKYRPNSPFFGSAHETIIATDSQGRLIISVDGSPPEPLTYHGGDKFSWTSSLDVTFAREKGTVVALRWSMDPVDVLFPRHR